MKLILLKCTKMVLIIIILTLWEYYAAIAEKDFRDVMDQIKVFSIEAINQS